MCHRIKYIYTHPPCNNGTCLPSRHEPTILRCSARVTDSCRRQWTHEPVTVSLDRCLRHFEHGLAESEYPAWRRLLVSHAIFSHPRHEDLDQGKTVPPLPALPLLDRQVRIAAVGFSWSLRSAMAASHRSLVQEELEGARGLSGPRMLKMSGFHEMWAREFRRVLAAAGEAFKDVRVGRPLEEQTGGLFGIFVIVVRCLFGICR